MNVNKDGKVRRTQAHRSATTRRALLDAARSLFAEKGYDEMEGEIDEEIEAAERAQSGLPEAVMAGYRAFVDAVLDPEMRRTFFLDGPSVLGWEWREIDARHAVGKIEEGLESLIEEGFVKPQPVGPLARLINGTLLEAAFFVAASEDPEAARDEVWGAMERLVGGLLKGRSTAQK